MQSATPGAATSPHLPVRQDWLDRRREEIIEPELPIVDPHHHLVDRPETGRYLLPELLADTGSGHNITATVYLEWLSMYRADGPAEMRPVGEVEFANGVAAMAASGTYGKTRVCAGIVGYADLMLGAPVEKVLEAMIAAGGGRFRGIRFITASHPGPGGLGLVGHPARGPADGPEGARGLRPAAPARPQLRRLDVSHPARRAGRSGARLSGDADRARPCRRRDRPRPLCRQTRRGLRRVERADPRAGGLPQCPHQARRARHADVRVRPASPGELPPSSEELAAAWRPYIETCIAAFGPERAMFESNFPVDKGSCGYAALWNAFKRIAAGCSAAEKAALFAGTATKFYQLQ